MKSFALFGAGRMAQAIYVAAAASPDYSIDAVISRNRPDWLTGVPFYGSLDEVDQRPEVLIDFSLPAGTQAAAKWCHDSGVPLLSGVTGFDQALREQLTETARTVPVLWSANLSIGVNLLAGLCRQAAGRMPVGTTVLIHDIHHQGKKDAPSGTALMLADTIRPALPTGCPEVRIHSVREGAIIGQHRVVFTLSGETLEFSHEAADRSVYATGALAAAAWLSGQSMGHGSGECSPELT
jgi:4-hydroxy-tetrahydrodipicolinate reductase